MDDQPVWKTILAGVIVFLTGGGLVKLIDMLFSRRREASEERKQARRDSVDEWKELVGQLRSDLEKEIERRSDSEKRHDDEERTCREQIDVLYKENGHIRRRLWKVEAILERWRRGDPNPEGDSSDEIKRPPKGDPE